MSTQTTDLGRDSIGKLLFKLATPAIIAQLVNVLYNIVDRIFIGRLPEGDLAMAGIGVAFPIIMLISATSALIGMGGAPLAAIKMGEQDHDGAEKIMSNALSMLVILSILLMMSLLIFKEPLLLAFGASSQTLVYANDYLGIYILGTLFVQIAIGMNPFINTQGFAKIGMMTVMVGAVVNIILDPMNKFLPFIPCSFCISLNIAFTNASSTTSAASTFASNASIKVGICSKFKNSLHSSVSNSTLSPKNIEA